MANVITGGEGGKKYSLNQIENEIIRPQFQEPRIHFAINYTYIEKYGLKELSLFNGFKYIVVYIEKTTNLQQFDHTLTCLINEIIKPKTLTNCCTLKLYKPIYEQLMFELQV